MHRVPWWKTWGYVGLPSVVVWGETECIAGLSPQVRQQADRTLAFGPLSAMPEASIGRTVILGGKGVGPLAWGPLGVATASPALMALASPSSSPEVAAAWTPIID